MPLADLETTLEPVLEAWQQESGPRTSLGDWIARVGDERIATLLGSR